MRHLALLFLLAGCGPAAAPPSPEGPRVSLRPTPEAGVVYEILHREARSIGDAEPVQLDTRTLLEITDVRPDGTRAARAYIDRRYPSGYDAGERLRSGAVRFVISADGRLDDDPEALCAGIDADRAGRYLRYLLGARALVLDDVAPGGSWRAELMTDAAELPQPARFRLDGVDAQNAEGRLLSRVSVEQGDVGGWRVTGAGATRGRFRVSLADGFSGRSDLRTEIEGEIIDGGRTRLGTVHVRSQILVRPSDEPRPGAFACGGVFDPSIVTRQIRARIRAVQECYEQRLRVDRTLAGRILVRFTVHEDGHVTGVEATEDTLGDGGHVARCLTDTIARFRFNPGPEGGSVSFAYPFVFAPQN